MRSRIENHLSRLAAPAEPENLKARCLATIPATARNSVQSQRYARAAHPLRQQLRVAAALMATAALSLAFWNTRPHSDDATMPPDSAAFAQTVEAMRRLTFMRCRGRQVKTGAKGGWRTTEWAVLDTAFDAARGIYSGIWPAVIPAADQHPAGGNSGVYRFLQLPDGTLYMRPFMSADLFISSDPQTWHRLSKNAFALLMGERAALAEYIPSTGGGAPQLISSANGVWKGRQARVFILLAKPPSDHRGAPAIRTQAYVDPATHLMTARQSFAVFADSTERLVMEEEYDYSRPDAALFNPGTLRVGARIHDQRQRKWGPSQSHVQ